MYIKRSRKTAICVTWELYESRIYISKLNQYAVCIVIH